MSTVHPSAGRDDVTSCRAGFAPKFAAFSPMGGVSFQIRGACAQRLLGASGRREGKKAAKEGREARAVGLKINRTGE